MRVLTAYPITVQGKNMTYSYANGKKKRQELVGSGKVKGFLEKLGGASTGLAGVLGGISQPQQESVSAPQEVLPPPAPEKKPLSMGAKIGIGVGIAAVLGIGAYFLMKKKK